MYNSVLYNRDKISFGINVYGLCYSIASWVILYGLVIVRPLDHYEVENGHHTDCNSGNDETGCR